MDYDDDVLNTVRSHELRNIKSEERIIINTLILDLFKDHIDELIETLDSMVSVDMVVDILIRNGHREAECTNFMMKILDHINFKTYLIENCDDKIFAMILKTTKSDTDFEYELKRDEDITRIDMMLERMGKFKCSNACCLAYLCRRAVETNADLESLTLQNLTTCTREYLEFIMEFFPRLKVLEMHVTFHPGIRILLTSMLKLAPKNPILDLISIDSGDDEEVANGDEWISTIEEGLFNTEFKAQLLISHTAFAVSSKTEETYVRFLNATGRLKDLSLFGMKTSMVPKISQALVNTSPHLKFFGLNTCDRALTPELQEFDFSDLIKRTRVRELYLDTLVGTAVNEDIYDLFVASKSLRYLLHDGNGSLFGPENERRGNNIKKVRRTAQILLGLRKFRTSELNRLPKDIVRLLAQTLLETFYDHAWDTCETF